LPSFFAGSEPPNQFDIATLRDDDQASYDLITAGNTTGVFQLESSGMKEMLVKLKPSCFEDVIAACALRGERENFMWRFGG
jgi:DNA polymerase-3 subunit alpha